MSKPQVSVVIPTYNRAVQVFKAVDSVLSQTFRDFEVIVVDDGSTDNTEFVLKAFGNKIQYIYQPNGGVSRARNTGIKAARAGLIAFLDSDDLWLPHKLQAQVDFFAANPSAMWQQTEEVWIRQGRRVNPKKRHTKLEGRIFKESLGLCLISPSAVMLRRELFDEFDLFDEKLPACEDYDLWLRILTKYPVYLDPSHGIIKQGGHADQLSSQPGLDAYRIRSLIKILHGCKLYPADRQALLAVLLQKCDIYAAGCEKRGRDKEAAMYRRIITKLTPLLSA